MSQPRPIHQPSIPNSRSQAAAPIQTLPQTQPESASLETLNPAQALELFISDPFAFVQQIVSDAAQTHLADLKEEAELKSALNAYRKKSPEFQRFEPFILQEVVTLLRDDPDGATASWEQLIEKAMQLFRQKFEATLQAKMDDPSEQTGASVAQPPHMESRTNRLPQVEPPSYTRKQIAKMSLAEFLKNEATINDAIQNNRIR